MIFLLSLSKIIPSLFVDGEDMIYILCVRDNLGMDLGMNKDYRIASFPFLVCNDIRVNNVSLYLSKIISSLPVDRCSFFVVLTRESLQSKITSPSSSKDFSPVTVQDFALFLLYCGDSFTMSFPIF